MSTLGKHSDAPLNGKSAAGNESVIISLYLPVPFKDIPSVIEKGDKGDLIRNLVSTVANILGLPATAISVSKVEASAGVRLDLTITAAEVWQKLDLLQDQIYDPSSKLATSNIDCKPYRAYVSAPRPSYHSIHEIHKEQAHFKLAAVSATQYLFSLAREEIKARETAEEAFSMAQNAESKLRQVSDAFSDVAINCTSADQTQKAHKILEEAQAAVKQASTLVSEAAKRALDLFWMAEQAKLAAYFCSARTGSKENFHDWARREAVFGLVPSGETISTPKSKFEKERDIAIEAETKAERANSRLNALTKALQELDPSSTAEIQNLSLQVQKAQEEFERATAEAAKAAERAARLHQESQSHQQQGLSIAQDPTKLFQETMKAAAAPPLMAPPTSEPLYKCSLGTGFIGTYAQVAEHERRLLGSMRAS